MQNETSKPASNNLIKVEQISKNFGSVSALKNIDLNLIAGQVLCLLGDNGAGKSTLIKILTGVYKPSSGNFFVEGDKVSFGSPRDAQKFGIAAVYQDLAMIPLMSVTRNFFMGRELLKKRSVLRQMDMKEMNKITLDEMSRIGISVRDPEQAVGTLSGGERQCVAIARAVYFGAKILILDEPTSALGVAQTSSVLRYIRYVRDQGLGVIFITHNVRHAYAVGDSFSVLNLGQTILSGSKAEISSEELQNAMAGGKEVYEFD